MYVQSEELSSSAPVMEGGVEEQEIVTFNDVGMAAPMNMGEMTDVFASEEETTAHLGDYLSRPVKIQSYTWTEGVAFDQNFNPWEDYFSNSVIKRKIDNFSRLRCKLKLKFVINSSPFYYGVIRANYLPMNFELFFNSADNFIQYSQTPGVYLEPSKMSTVEMTLPFLWTGSWLNVADSNEFQKFGTVRMLDFYPLASANGVVGTGITINVYAWAEELTVAGPTVGLALQSDEYSQGNKGTISGPATAVAGIAASLSNVPFIGMFARATTIGATAVSGIAQLFGYSNPPVIDDVQPYQPKSFHAFANVETRMPIDKLCLDPKNEVTIDNSVCDIESIDSLSFQNTICRESLVEIATWAGSDPPDTSLITAAVNPAYQRETVLTSQRQTIYPPCSYFGKMFGLWRGTMIYKFKFVKTQYHKGRILIAWDPNSDVTGQTDLETAIFTRVVDLEFEDEVEISIPYKGKTPYLQVSHRQDISVDNPPTIGAFSLVWANGTFSMRVLNVLTGPAANPEVGILMYSRPGDDFKYARPRNITPGLTTLPVQSQEVDISHNKPSSDTALDLITVGETLMSLRPILHRTSFHHIERIGQVRTSATLFVNAGTQMTTNIIPRMPNPYGYSTPTGINWAFSTLGAGNIPFNYAATHPLRWVTDCFVGYRGSTTVHINPICPGEIVNLDSVSASRYYKNPIILPLYQNRNRYSAVTPPTQDSGLASQAVGTYLDTIKKDPGQSGMTLTNTNTQSALSFNVPQYIWTRFNVANFTRASKTWQDGDEIYDNIVVNTTYQLPSGATAGTTMPSMEVYYSAGVDFNPVFFVCTPTIYSYDTAPSPSNVYTP